MTDVEDTPWWPMSRQQLISLIDTRIHNSLHDVDRRITAVEGGLTMLGEQLMATQADIDAVTQALAAEDSDLNQAVSDLTTSVSAITDEIAALQQANPQLDLTALQNEVANSQAKAAAVRDAVASAAALVPAPAPAPTPEPPASS